MERLHRIRAAVDDLSTVAPETDDSELMWFKPDRGSPDYYRLVPTDDMENGPYYDVWFDADTLFNRTGFLEVAAQVVMCEGTAVRVESEQVFSFEFTGHDQPREQAFVNNVHHYERQARESVEQYAEIAETRLIGERAETPA